MGRPPLHRRALLALALALPTLLAACGSEPAAGPAAGSTAGSTAGPAAEPGPRPNVVLFTIDTLRADHTTLGGHDRDTTPAIAAWAEDGVVFERAWANSSWTLPSVTMLLTGRPRPERGGDLRPEDRPIAERLRAAGYRTGAVVANPIVKPELGFDRGFDAYDHVPKPEDLHASNSWTGDEVVERGLAWLDASADEERPFFLMLHLFDPHAPYWPSIGMRFEARDDPARLAAMRAALRPEHAGLLDHEAYAKIERYRALYESEVLQADQAFARLLDELAARGVLDDTLIVVTSDHGEGLWQRAPNVGEKLPEGLHFPQLYMGHGAQLHTEQVHVPLAIGGAGVRAAGRRSDEVQLVDVLPTVLARLGLSAGDDVGGVDLLAEPPPAPRPVFAVCSRGATVTLDGRWRLHRPAEYRVERHGAAPELFDLEADPLELAPLDDPDRAAALGHLLDDWQHRWSTEGAPPPAQVDPEHLELLRQLGYTGEADLAEEARDAGSR